MKRELTAQERNRLFNDMITPHTKLVGHAVDRYYPRNIRTTSDRRDDMIQLCLIKLHATIHTFIGSDIPITALIMSVCKHVCYKQFYKVNDTLGLNRMGVQSADDKGYQTDSDMDYELLFLFESGLATTAYNVPEEEFLNHCNDRIKQAINQLSELHRRLFMGVIFGYSITEVAQKLVDENIMSEKHLDPNNLILQYHFAIKQLRKKLQTK